MSAETIAIALVGTGLIVVSCVSATTWKSRPRLRLLPILYGVAAGAGIAVGIQGERELGPSIQAALVGAGMGAVMSVIVWLNARS
jgi:hypothetical protein